MAEGAGASGRADGGTRVTCGDEQAGADLAASVARYYDTAIFEAELARLTHDCPVERQITLRWLERLAPANAEVAEIGVGGGIYSEYLARKGCRLRLVDVSARLLDAAAARLRGAGLGESIAGVHRESATRLDSLAAGTFDTGLMLGPLYHLCALEARRQAVAEAARILKPGGMLFAHLSPYAEFRALFADEFEELALTGVESFSTSWQGALNDLPLAEAEAWLDLIERTGETAEGLGVSDHYLYVGRKAP